MGTPPKGNRKQWQPGDLVLHEADPKTHAMLMEIKEVKQNQARAVYLDARSRAKAVGGDAASKPNEGWLPLEELQDPALFLKTEEFLQTLRERTKRGLPRHSFSP